MRERYVSRNQVRMVLDMDLGIGTGHPAPLTFLQCHLHTGSQEGTELTSQIKCCRIRPVALGEGWSARSGAGRAGQVLTINS